MADYDWTAGTGCVAAHDIPLKKEVDFAVTPLLNTKTAEIIHIPAGFYLHFVVLRVVTGEGAAETIDLGDEDSANRWWNDLSIQTANTGVLSATAAYFYAAAKHLILLANADLTVGKIRVYAYGQYAGHVND